MPFNNFSRHHLAAIILGSASIAIIVKVWNSWKKEEIEDLFKPPALQGVPLKDVIQNNETHVEIAPFEDDTHTYDSEEGSEETEPSIDGPSDDKVNKFFTIQSIIKHRMKQIKAAAKRSRTSAENNQSKRKVGSNEADCAAFFSQQDQERYFERYFEYEVLPEEYSEARKKVIVLIEGAIAHIKGRRMRFNKEETIKENENPDPILQVASSVEVSLRHRILYFAQQIGLELFREDEDARLVTETYIGTIPIPSDVLSSQYLYNSYTPTKAMKLQLLETIKDYLEVCSEIDRLKPIVVDINKREAMIENGKNTWKNFEEIKYEKLKVDYDDPYIDDDSTSDNETNEQGHMKDIMEVQLTSLPPKLADIYRQQFNKRQVVETKDGDDFEWPLKTSEHQDKDDDDDYYDIDDEDDEGEIENDPEDAMEYIGTTLHDTNRRAFEAAVIRAVLKQIAPSETTEKWINVLNKTASGFIEPYDPDNESEYFSSGDDEAFDERKAIKDLEKNLFNVQNNDDWMENKSFLKNKMERGKLSEVFNKKLEDYLPSSNNQKPREAKIIKDKKDNNDNNADDLLDDADADNDDDYDDDDEWVDY